MGKRDYLGLIQLSVSTVVGHAVIGAEGLGFDSRAGQLVDICRTYDVLSKLSCPMR